MVHHLVGIYCTLGIPQCITRLYYNTILFELWGCEGRRTLGLTRTLGRRRLGEEMHVSAFGCNGSIYYYEVGRNGRSVSLPFACVGRASG